MLKQNGRPRTATAVDTHEEEPVETVTEPNILSTMQEQLDKLISKRRMRSRTTAPKFVSEFIRIEVFPC